MAMIAECINCGKRYSVGDALAGRKVKCKNCGNVFTIGGDAPALSPEPADPFAALAEMERLANGGTAAPRRATPRTAPRVAAQPTDDFSSPPPPVSVSDEPVVPHITTSKSRRFGRSRKTGAAGVDSATPFLLLAYVVLSLASTLYVTMTKLGDVAPEAHGKMVGLIWSLTIAQIILFFAVLGPAMFLGVFITSKIFRFPLVDLPYLRGCGVAAVPALFVGLLALLPGNTALTMLGVVLILPAAFYVLKNVFDLDLIGAAVALAICGALYLAAQFASQQVVNKVVVEALFKGGVQQQQQGLTLSTGSGESWKLPIAAPGASAMGHTNSGGGAQHSASEIAAKQLGELKTRAQSFGAENWESSSREEVQPRLAALRGEFDAIKRTKATESSFNEVSWLLNELETRVAALPSEKPDPGIFEAPPATTVWTVASSQQSLLGDEVSYKNYKLSPPNKAFIDLRTSEKDPAGLSWQIKGNSAPSILTFAMHPATNARQQRPFTPSRAFLRRGGEADRLFTIDAENANVTYGRINGVPFTRVASNPGDSNSTGRWIKYAAREGDQWLLVSITAPPDESQQAEVLDASARTLRKAKPGEEHVDPLTTDVLVARLADDPSHAAVLLRARGRAVEDALIIALASPDAALAQHAAEVLADVGTEKSFDALRDNVKSDKPQVADAARAALRKLDPKHFSGSAELLSDLEDDNSPKQQEAIEKLAKMQPDANRAKVVAVLKSILFARDKSMLFEPASKALMVWGDPKTDPRLVSDLFPLLAQDVYDPERRHVAMKILSTSNDKRAVPLILNWLILDPEPTIDALKSMGPLAEDEIVRMNLLRDKNPVVRRNAARILEEAGGVKSIDGLTKAAHDQRDPIARQAAEDALDAVKERLKANNGASSKPAK